MIQGGRAVINEKSTDQVRALFQGYLSGLSLAEAAKEAGIKRYHSSLARMLTNKRYLGDDFYPPIIDDSTFDAVQAERVRRAQLLGRMVDQVKTKSSVRPLRFTISSIDTQYKDPFRQAEYAYSLIESEVHMDGG
jgi:hypothetical protein